MFLIQKAAKTKDPREKKKKKAKDLGVWRRPGPDSKAVKLSFGPLDGTLTVLFSSGFHIVSSALVLNQMTNAE